MATPQKKGGAPATPAKPGNKLATQAANSLAVMTAPEGMELATLMEDAQQGHGFKQEDLATPFLRIAQALSPEVNPRDDKYIEGCEVGHFIDTQARESFPADVAEEAPGLILIPVHHEQSFIQWKPRKAGGGLVRDWGTDASAVDKTVYDDKENKRLFPDGTELVQSNKYFVLAIDPTTNKAREMVFMLAGMQRKKAKQWNTKIAAIQVPRPGGGGTFNPAMWYVAYEVKTIYEENDKGNWYGITVPKPVSATVNLPDGAALYIRARDFAAMIAAGAVKTQAPVQDAEFEINEGGGADDDTV